MIEHIVYCDICGRRMPNQNINDIYIDRYEIGTFEEISKGKHKDMCWSCRNSLYDWIESRNRQHVED